MLNRNCTMVNQRSVHKTFVGPLQQKNVSQRTWDGDICRRFIKQLWSIVQAPLEVHQIRFECSTVWRVKPLIDTLQSISGLFCATISSPRRVPGQYYTW